MFNNTINATVFSGTLEDIVVTYGGAKYNIGDRVNIVSQGSGSYAKAYVSDVSNGSILGANVNYGGCGFQANNYLLLLQSPGTVNGFVTSVDTSGASNSGPSTLIAYTTLHSELANVWMNSANFGVSGNTILHTQNANTTYENSLSNFVFANVGPAQNVLFTSSGNNFKVVPPIYIQGNSMLFGVSSLGRMKINNGGVGYQVGDLLVYTNPLGGLGYGANGKVVSVDASGSINQVIFTRLHGQDIGGSGYDPKYLPTITVNSANISATGANITISDMLCTGATFNVNTDSIGSINKITIKNKGHGFDEAPLIDLTKIGDGTAQAYANIITGFMTYPGRYDSGVSRLSSFSFLQNRDYYQNFSYDIRVKKSIYDYQNYVKTLIHPAGEKMWGSYMIEKDENITSISLDASKQVNQNVFIANAVSFTAASLYGTQNVVTTTPSTEGTFSGWFLLNNLPNNTTNYILSLGQDRFTVGVNEQPSVSANIKSNVSLTIRATDNTGNTSLVLTTHPKDIIYTNAWFHIVASWNISSGQAHIYLNNVSSFSTKTIGNTNIQYNPSINVATNFNNTKHFDGALSEIWFTDNYIDLSNISLRSQFIINLQPSNKLKANIVTTGSSSLVPKLYIRSNAYFSNVNSGISGNLIKIGTPEDYDNPPNFI
jgi:hypothetical protein